MFEGCKIYGPYFNGLKKHRKTVVIIFPDGSKRKTNYARYLMSVHLNRELQKDEHVHHIDGNYMNDTIENLAIVNDKDHVRFHHLEEPVLKECAECKREFLLAGDRLSMSKSKKKWGDHEYIFCSLRCSGIHSSKKNKRIRQLVREIMEQRSKNV